jgi:antitoxin (DNA-binding transcriptional repressor) of toxin-antitoxin stability system
MLRRIGLSEAKTNLSKIAEQVNRTGQSVTLTRYGESYVDLIPHQNPVVSRRPQAQVIEELEKLRQELSKSSFEQIKADINEGRR